MGLTGSKTEYLSQITTVVGAVRGLRAGLSE